MNLILEGYDEYVKDFEELRKSTDVLPKTEDEIKERAAERLEIARPELKKAFTYVLEREDTNMGQMAFFAFEAELDEDRTKCYIRYQEYNLV